MMHNLYMSLLLLLAGLQCASALPASGNAYQLMEDVLTAVERVLDYYRRMYRDMNVDGIFGLKIAEGQAKLMLRAKDRFKIPPVYYKRIQNIYVQTVNISNLALPHLREADEAYFQQTLPMIRPWDIWMEQRDLDDKLIWRSSQLDFKFELNETFSDHCLSELMTPVTCNNATQPCPRSLCNISEPCRTIMLNKRGTRSYTITHQVMYAHVVHMMGCTAAVNRLQTHSLVGNRTWTLSWWENELCTNILASVTEKLMSEMGAIRQQDLFMEEIFVCGVLGFSMFTRPSFARKILTWQQPSGCFAPRGVSATARAPTRAPPRAVRALLAEKDLKDGCLAHKTSVALGALSALLHTFVESDEHTIDYNPPKHNPNKPVQLRVDPVLMTDVIDIQSFKQLTDSEYRTLSRASRARYSGFQWAFPLVTVILTLVLLWRVRAFRLCQRRAISV